MSFLVDKMKSKQVYDRYTLGINGMNEYEQTEN